MKTDNTNPAYKAVIDSLLLQIRGVEAGEMSGLPAYFINKRMFACIANGGVGIRLPAATAANLQFSNQNASPFQPKGMPATREWVQLSHEDSASYEKDKDLFLAAIEFVKAQR